MSLSPCLGRNDYKMNIKHTLGTLFRLRSTILGCILGEIDLRCYTLIYHEETNISIVRNDLLQLICKVRSNFVASEEKRCRLANICVGASV